VFRDECRVQLVYYTTFDRSIVEETTECWLYWIKMAHNDWFIGSIKIYNDKYVCTSILYLRRYDKLTID